MDNGLERFAEVEENRLEDALALARSSLWPFTNEVAKASKCCHGAKVWEVWKSCFYILSFLTMKDFHCNEGLSAESTLPICPSALRIPGDGRCFMWPPITG